MVSPFSPRNGGYRVQKIYLRSHVFLCGPSVQDRAIGEMRQSLYDLHRDITLTVTHPLQCDKGKGAMFQETET
jgi:hypothetical protein